jgi:hypothetical protein
MTDSAANWWVQREEASVRQTRLRQELRLNERKWLYSNKLCGKELSMPGTGNCEN